MGALFSRARSTAEFWKNICQGKDLIEDVPTDHWLIEDYLDPKDTQSATTYCRRGSFVPYVSFNPIEFGIPPDRICSIAPTQLLTLLVTKQVLEDVSNHQVDDLNLKKTGMVMGVAAIQEIANMVNGLCETPLLEYLFSKAGLDKEQIEYMLNAIEISHSPLNESTFPGLLGNIVSGRAANRFNLGGINCTVDAACASSLASIDVAIDKLNNHQMDMMLAGGADTANDPMSFIMFSKTPALSPTHDCRPFSENGDGIVLGEGVGIVALKRLEDAIKDKNKIYAVINGTGISSDGRVKSIYSPYVEGQSLALRRCYENAKVDPADIELIEAHGTSTKAGDQVEITSLKSMFSNGNDPKSIALGSIKSQIGHTKASAGIAGLLKVILALHHKVIPPSIKAETLHPLLKGNDHPFYVPDKVAPWYYKGTPRRGSVSAFGFGGINYHLTLEEYRSESAPYFEHTRQEKLFLFSANSKEELVDKIQEVKNKIQQNIRMIEELEHENWCDVQGGKLRVAVLCINEDDVLPKLETTLDCIANEKSNQYVLTKTMARTGKIAFLCPGHGSQYKHMGKDLLLGFQHFRNVYDELSKIDIDDNYSIQNVVFDDSVSSDVLTNTKYAQPTIISTSVLYSELLERLNITPDFLIGHSLGELTALYHGGAYDEKTLIEIAKDRGKLMSEALDEDSGMLVIFDAASVVIAILDDSKLELEIANYNSKNQTVVCGKAQEIQKLIKILEANNIGYVKLATKNAYHSSKYGKLSEKFKKVLSTKEITSPKKVVIANINGLPYSDSKKDVLNALSVQLKTSVKFMQSVQRAYDQGVRTFIELGPNNILSKLVKDIVSDKNVNVICLDNPKIDHGLYFALAELFVNGLGDHIDKLILDKFNCADTPFDPNSKLIKINGTCYNKVYPKLKTDDAISEFKGMPKNNASEQNINVAKNTPHKASGNGVLDQLISAHLAYQQNLLEAHKAFLKTVSHMSNGNGAAISDFAESANIDLEKTVQKPTMQTASPAFKVKNTSPIPSGVKESRSDIKHAHVPEPPPEPAAPPTPAQPLVTPKPAPIKAKTPAASNDVEQVKADLFNIVSETLGYDPSLLSLDMNIESDLGIDSLRRVELLTNVNDLYEIPEDVDTNLLSSLKTLEDIVNFIATLKKK